jgi:hypothetical protein
VDDIFMKIKCITCEVLARPVYLCAAASQHIVDVELHPRGLHDRPSKLRDHLQERIDAAEDQGYEAIVFGYGLCGKGIVGLAARKTRLVFPRAHDCITLFLGSRDRYNEQFENYPGTFWYVQDYVERNDGSGGSLAMGSSLDTDTQAVYESYVKKYGKDNADYLMETMGAWQQHYKRAVYIDMGVGDGSSVEERTQAMASRRGWSFEHMEGSLLLVRRLLEGDWEANDDFLVVPPGKKLEMTSDEEIITCFSEQPSQ